MKAKQMLEKFKTFSFGDHIENPDKIINPTIIDPQVRIEYGEPHPFPNQRSGKWKGCYLFYADIFENQNVALYAGQTVNFGIRLHQHWNGIYDFFNGWQPSVLSRLFDYDDVYDEFISSMFFAYWVIPQKRERILFEHKLIGNLRPLCNIN